jgi:hypothetical protein
MKSKTLELIKRYYMLLEQDDQNMENNVDQEQPPPEGQDVTEMPAEQPPQQDTVPLSSSAELRYIEDVVLAALKEKPFSDQDRIAFENLQALLKKPDKIERIQNTGQTAKDFYIKEITPILRPEKQEQEIRDNLDTIS